MKVLLFPFFVFVRLLPWSIFLWAPSCAALIPLQDNPLFGKFHRILFIALLVLLWFNPASSSRDLFYLMPLIATMIGSFYWIIVRRYGEKICSVSCLYAWCLLAATVLAALFLFLPVEILSEILRKVNLYSLLEVRQSSLPLWFLIPELLVPAAVVFVVLLFRRRISCWLVICMLFCGTMLLYCTVRAPYLRAQNEKQFFAGKLQNIFQMQKLDHEKELIYTNINGLYAEGFYAGYRFLYTDTENVPDEKQVIYLLTAKTPLDPSRSWNQIAETEYKGQRLFVYKGQLNRSEDDYDNEI